MGLVRDLSVQDHDVILDDHVYPREIEAAPDGTERAQHAIPQHVVGHVGVRTPIRESVHRARRCRSQVPHAAVDAAACAYERATCGRAQAALVQRADRAGGRLHSFCDLVRRCHQFLLRDSGSEYPNLARRTRTRHSGAVPFVNRVDAGRRLAVTLRARAGLEDPVVLGLPRGGVPVAAEVAAALHAPLDVILVRKIGLPGQPELAMGAVGEDGVVVVNDAVMRDVRVDAETFARVAARERSELEQRAARLRAVRARVALEGRTAIIVDDGIATGSTARAAAAVARAHGAARVVVATPVAPPTTRAELRDAADDVVVTETPQRFHAIGEFYVDFRPTAEEEVVRLLSQARG